MTFPPFPEPPPSPSDDLIPRRATIERSPWSILPVLLVAAALVGVLVCTPTSSPVDFVRQPLTQAGADRAAGAILVAWDDPDQLQFVSWDIRRLTGCVPLAVSYVGPEGRTDPRSIPEDIEPTVVGRAHSDTERMTVWFGCG
jgi:hypothetical protein